MKALTICQPRATLVALCAKCIETRNWATTYRGPLAIHAGAGLGPVRGMRGLRALVAQEPFFSALVDSVVEHAPQRSLADEIVNSLPRGAIVATCELVDCVPSEKIVAAFGAYGPEDASGGRMLWALSDQELAFGNYAPGRYGWLLANIQPLAEPIPARGQLGLWEWRQHDHA